MFKLSDGPWEGRGLSLHRPAIRKDVGPDGDLGCPGSALRYGLAKAQSKLTGIAWTEGRRDRPELCREMVRGHQIRRPDRPTGPRGQSGHTSTSERCPCSRGSY